MTIADDTTLLLKRVFEAPSERVFDAWLSREEWQAWIGPEGVECDVFALDPRVGGGYRLDMCMPGGDGSPWPASSRVSTGLEASASPGGPKAISTRQSLITLTFTELGDKTELTLRQEGLGSVSNRDQHGQGWNSALNKLNRHLKQGRN